jgi:hypothetical protein
VGWWGVRNGWAACEVWVDGWMGGFKEWGDGVMGGRRNGRRVGCLYMYCLPPAGVLHSQNKVINAPQAQS